MKPTSMTKLLNKIERRLGTKPLNLPDYLKKNEWGSVIQEDTLDTFSRFFPLKIPYKIDVINDKASDGYYYIDEDKIPGDVEILGVRDLVLEKFAKDSAIIDGGFINIYDQNYGIDDVMLAQMSADISSIYNYGIYVEFQEPNRLSIKSAFGEDLVVGMNTVDVDLFIKHSPNLATISATKMEEFEKLAIIDIKIFLYNGLKHFDKLETVFANIDLKIDDWANAEGDRESIVEQWREQYVSAANTNQPMFYVV